MNAGTPFGAVLDVARKKKKKHEKSSEAPQQGATASQVRNLLAAGKDKLALEAAKQLAKREAGAEAEELLCEAYAARIRGLRLKGMIKEAEELGRLALARFPRLEAEMGDEHLVHAVRGGRADGLLGELATPGLERDRRRALEEILRKELRDPRLVRDSSLLPEDHPLREAARQVWEALEAATTRLVEEDELSFAGVSPRGPFAPWKPFILAIAAFHRGDKAEMEDQLSRIPGESACAKIIPVMQGLAEGRRPPAEAGRSAQALGHLVLETGVQSLKEALRRLEVVKRSLDEDQEIDNMVAAARAVLKVQVNLPRELRRRLERVVWLKAFWFGGIGLLAIPESRHWPADDPFLLLGIVRPLGGYPQLLPASAWLTSRALDLLVEQGLLDDDSAGKIPILERITKYLLDFPTEEAIHEALRDILEPRGPFNPFGPPDITTLVPAAVAKDLKAAAGSQRLPMRLRPGQALLEACRFDPDEERIGEAFMECVNSNWKDAAWQLIEEWTAAFPESPAPHRAAVQYAFTQGQVRAAVRALDGLERLGLEEGSLTGARIKLSLLRIRKNFSKAKLGTLEKEIQAISESSRGIITGESPLADLVEWYIHRQLGQGDARWKGAWSRVANAFDGSETAAKGFAAALISGLQLPHQGKLEKRVRFNRKLAVEDYARGFLKGIDVIGPLLLRLEETDGLAAFLHLFGRDRHAVRFAPEKLQGLLMVLKLWQAETSLLKVAASMLMTEQPAKNHKFCLAQLLHWTYEQILLVQDLVPAVALMRKFEEEGVEEFPEEVRTRVEGICASVESDGHDWLIEREVAKHGARRLLTKLRGSYWTRYIWWELFNEDPPPSRPPAKGRRKGSKGKQGGKGKVPVAPAGEQIDVFDTPGEDGG